MRLIESSFTEKYDMYKFLYLNTTEDKRYEVNVHFGQTVPSNQWLTDCYDYEAREQQFLNLVSGRYFYVQDVEERALLTEISKAMVEVLELPISVRTVAHPGSSLVIFEYSNRILDNTFIKDLYEAIKFGIEEREVVDIEQEPDVAVVKEEEPVGTEVVDYDMQFVGTTDEEFIEDDIDFNLGEVEKHDD
jgi:hypothetical protein